uniref:[acyl-carrier-protein] S-malonyltransferase n=1 Tax=Sorangium cellulosum TaxID=56 RepID=A0A0M5KTQ6_SORCE|nr:tandem AT-AT-ER domain protein [Sorangium cellulosum]
MNAPHGFTLPEAADTDARPVVFMFSGQGSQYYQMGRDLFEKDGHFRGLMRDLDDRVRRMRGRSVLEHIYMDGRMVGEHCGHLEFSHPAIFMIEFALARVLIDAGVAPTHLLGASMGEFASCAIAGALPVDEVLEAIFEQIDAVREHCPEGGMLAILHDPELYEASAVLREGSELAGINFSTHFVVSGKPEALHEIKQWLHAKGVLFQELPARYAFHSSMMDSAAPGYRAYLRTKTLQRPSIPLVSCLHGQVVTELSDDYLWEMVRRPILLRSAVAAAEGLGAEVVYVDVGPAGTMANFVKYNLNKGAARRIFPIVTSFARDAENLHKLKEYCARRTEAAYTTRHSMKETSKKAIVFPGQGSQKTGMGADLFDDFPELVAKADAILGYSIRELCLENQGGRLGQTEYTQPALYVVNAMTYLRWRDRTGGTPDFCAGHSLGEYNALAAAGVFDFETGLRLVQKRGELMARSQGGAMAAVIGLGEVELRQELEQSGLHTIDVANFNSPDQIVISGPKDALERAREPLEKRGARSFILLPVSNAFHSRYMEPAAGEFAAYLRRFRFDGPATPVVSNVGVGLYTAESAVELLSKQLTSPVRWTEGVELLLERGVAEFIECGPGQVLTRLIQKIRAARPAASPSANGSPAGASAAATAAAPSAPTPLAAPPAPTPLAAPPAPSAPTPLAAPRATPPAPSAMPSAPRARKMEAAWLGDATFRRDYGVRYAYVAGGLPRGISSVDLVAKLSRAGLLGFLGTAGIEVSRVGELIGRVQREVEGRPFGVSISSSPSSPAAEEKVVDVLLRYGVRNVEAIGYFQVSPALVRYRLKGLTRGADGLPVPRNRLLVRVLRPELAEAFASPPPEDVVERLLADGAIGREEAELARRVAVADDLCLESEPGSGVEVHALLPVVRRIRDDVAARLGGARRVRVGVTGVGHPSAIAAAFFAGADFVLSGALNQCTAEAATSEAVKRMLERVGVQDTESVPSGDLLETGARVQVLKKGLFFPARAAKLHQIYCLHESLDEVSEKTKKQIQERFFRRSFGEVYQEITTTVGARSPDEIERAERSPKHKMALLIRWYFDQGHRLAMGGDEDRRVDFQVLCDPALGAFNHWVKGSSLESWRYRHADDIAERLMTGAAELLDEHVRRFGASSGPHS